MVSICLTIDNYFLNRECIENMLSRCKENEVELLVSNNTFDGKASEYINRIIKDEKFYHVKRVGEIDEFILNRATAINRLLSETRGDYICVFDSSAMVSNGWLYDLKYFHSLINNSGITAIPEFNTKKVYSPLMDKNDEFVNVWKPELNYVSGILFFKKEHLKLTGCFSDVSENYVELFSKQFVNAGFENFYIPGQICILTKQKIKTQ